MKIVTSDVTNFIRAFRDANLSADPAAVYDREYFSPGSDGLRAFIPHRLKSPQNLAEKTREYREYYESAIPSLTVVPLQGTAIVADLERFKRIYPQAVFPDIYFVIGAMNSGAALIDNVGLVIGAEKYGRSDTFSKIGMPTEMRKTIGRVGELPGIVAHGVAHYNQVDADPTTLLDNVLFEGSADFVSQLIDGHRIDHAQWSFGCAHERALWSRFHMQMHTRDQKSIDSWLTILEQKPMKAPPYIGYWLGSRITQTYYASQKSKEKALNTILHIASFDEFLKRSGYPEHKPACLPPVRLT